MAFRNEQIAESLVACFDAFGPLQVRPGDAAAADLARAEDGTVAATWKPAKVAAQRGQVERLYQLLGAKFPPLYEELVLAWRWADVDLGAFVLLANPPGRTLGGLHGGMVADEAFARLLIPARLIPFGRGAAQPENPVCFATARKRPTGDCPVVELDGRELRGSGRVRSVRELAPSFERLVDDVLADARRRKRQAAGLPPAASGRLNAHSSDGRPPRHDRQHPGSRRPGRPPGSRGPRSGR